MSLEITHLLVGHSGQPLWGPLDLRAAPGQAIAVLGANGSGKSSLLRTICGDLTKLSGNVKRPKGGVAWLSQAPGLISDAPVRVIDVARMGLWAKLKFFGRACHHDEALVGDALELVGLSDFARTPVAELSGGQLQRLMFARLTVQDCPLILLDEPFSAVDSATKAALLDVIDAWVGKGKIVLAALHDLDAARRFPIWLELARGAAPVFAAPTTKANTAVLRVLSPPALSTDLTANIVG